MEPPSPQRGDAEDRSLGDIGGRLKYARERRGVSLAGAAAATKLSLEIVRAIERNDFDRLPAGMYRKAYIRTLAAEFGLDPDTLVTEYAERFDVAPESASLHSAPARPEQELLRQLTPAPRRSLVTLAGCVAAAAAWFVFYPRAVPSGSHDNAFDEPTSAVASLKAVAQDDPAAKIVEPGGIAAATVTLPIRIEMTMTGRCWVSGEADGARVIYRMVEPGESVVLEAERAISLRVGDAGAVMLSINGGSRHVAGVHGEVVDLSVTAEDVKHLARIDLPRPVETREDAEVQMASRRLES